MITSGNGGWAAAGRGTCPPDAATTTISTGGRWAQLELAQERCLISVEDEDVVLHQVKLSCRALVVRFQMM